MKTDLSFCQISREHLLERLPEYIELSSDASTWRGENFLMDLPGKWLLSFAVFYAQRPIGYCFMSLIEGGIHIHHFMVAKDFRGKGIGMLMLQQAKEIAAHHSATLTLKVHRCNERAMRFYQRHGFASSKPPGEYWTLSFPHEQAD